MAAKNNTYRILLPDRKEVESKQHWRGRSLETVCAASRLAAMHTAESKLEAGICSQGWGCVRILASNTDLGD